MVAEATLDVVDGEAADAREVIMVEHTELIGEFNFFASFVELLFVLILTLHVSQRHKSS